MQKLKLQNSLLCHMCYYNGKILIENNYIFRFQPVNTACIKYILHTTGCLKNLNKYEIAFYSSTSRNASMNDFFIEMIVWLIVI